MTEEQKTRLEQGLDKLIRDKYIDLHPCQKEALHEGIGEILDELLNIRSVTQLAVKVRNRLFPLLQSPVMQTYCQDAHQAIQDLCQDLYETYMTGPKAKRPDIVTKTGYKIPGLGTTAKPPPRVAPECCD